MLPVIFLRTANAIMFNSNHTVSRQAGIALPLTLILLLVMTLIAVATLRTTTLEENMSANNRLRQVAFNAAESALTEAERVVRNLTGQRRRDLFFGNGIIAPDPAVANTGDTCDDGFCTPAKFTSPAAAIQPSDPPQNERWNDPRLDVWNTADRNIEYANYDLSGLADEGVFEPPQYIIEFLGNFDSKPLNVNLASNPTVRPRFSGPFVGNCRNPTTNALESPNDVWPYCASDPGVYRITVRATAGPPARQSVVFMQSTIQIPF